MTMSPLAVGARPDGERAMGLQCVLGRRDVLLPADIVEQVRSFEVSAVPRTRDHVGGVATIDDGLVVTLVPLGLARSDVGSRTTLAALLVPFAGEPMRWAIEVSRVGSLVPVTLLGATTASEALADVSHHRWFDEAMTTEGAKIPWLRVDRLLADCGVQIPPLPSLPPLPPLATRGSR